MKRRDWAICLVLVVAAAAGGTAVLRVARHGAGVSPDSVHYIQAARNLLEGRGYVYQDGPGHYVAMTHWPPFYPLVLTLPGLVGVDPLPGARAVGSVLLALTLLLVGLTVYRRSGSSVALALFAMLAVASVQTMLWIHAMAWSEPLFVLLTMLGLVALAHHFDRPTWGWLLLASLATAGAFLSRYVGIAVVAAGSLGLLLWRKGSYLQRVRDCLIFGTIACLPIATWMARNVSTAGTATDRELSPRVLGAGNLLQGMETLQGWLVPTTLAYPLKCVAVAALIAGAATYAVLLVRSRPKPAGETPQPAQPARLLPLLLLFAGMYVGALICAMVIANPSCDLGPRYLAPIVPALIVVLTCAVHDRLRAAGRPPVARLVFAVLCVVFIVTNLLQTVPWASHVRHSGAGFFNRYWRNSEIIARVAKLPPDVPVYSDRSEAIYILAGRSTYTLPRADGSEKARKKVALMGKRLQEEAGVVVDFASADRPYLLSLEKLKEALPLRLVFEGKDGAIYQWGGPPAQGPEAP